MDEDTRPIRVPQVVSRKGKLGKSKPRRIARDSLRKEEIELLAKEVVREQKRTEIREKERGDIINTIRGCGGCVVMIVILGAVIYFGAPIWQSFQESVENSGIARGATQAAMTPCERTLQEINRVTISYGRLELENSASERPDGLCDINFYYWTDKPTDYERYDERNKLLRSIGRVITNEDLPIGRLNLRTYAPNQSGSYSLSLWEHEIFPKSELPYN